MYYINHNSFLILGHMGCLPIIKAINHIIFFKASLAFHRTNFPDGGRRKFMIGKTVEVYKDVYAYGPFDLIVELGSSLGRLLSIIFLPNYLN